MPGLAVDGIHTYYEDSHVLHGVSIDVAPGEAVALLGRNGAGKTTVIRSIVGFTPPRAGRVIWEDAAIEGWRLPIARRGSRWCAGRESSRRSPCARTLRSAPVRRLVARARLACPAPARASVEWGHAVGGGTDSRDRPALPDQCRLLLLDEPRGLASHRRAVVGRIGGG